MGLLHGSGVLPVFTGGSTMGIHTALTLCCPLGAGCWWTEAATAHPSTPCSSGI